MAKTGVVTGNHYLLFLRNGVVLDGRPDGHSRKVFEAAVQRDREAAVFNNGLLGVGNKVNHPPRGIAPNVHVLPLDLGRDEHVDLHPHLPVVHARPPPPGSAWKRTAVLVASRELCDEELLLDYKLREHVHALPEWYTACEPQSSPAEASSACAASLSPGYYY